MIFRYVKKGCNSFLLLQPFFVIIFFEKHIIKLLTIQRKNDKIITVIKLVFNLIRNTN